VNRNLQQPPAKAMAVLRTILSVALLGLAVGCGGGEKAPPTGGDAVAAPEDVDLAGLRYNTGDRAIWPDHDLPIVHRFDPPEVPKSIRGPFPLETIPQDGPEVGVFSP